ncbi:hypothetical protein BV25DRAFT_1841629 [Artomyces pyxidatus]|uniref:Uncharacterized protein n=1 Tax=Artomyces pyxidatus TaxID=48021 RepID=A0ACB8SM37_9AGAM|nr:hypothetical protein BV25DRAFT_1841629 [Artomyces pyxidatus]
MKVAEEEKTNNSDDDEQKEDGRSLSPLVDTLLAPPSPFFQTFALLKGDGEGRCDRKRVTPSIAFRDSIDERWQVQRDSRQRQDNGHAAYPECPVWIVDRIRRRGVRACKDTDMSAELVGLAITHLSSTYAEFPPRSARAYHLFRSESGPRCQILRMRIRRLDARRLAVKERSGVHADRADESNTGQWCVCRAVKPVDLRSTGWSMRACSGEEDGGRSMSPRAQRLTKTGGERGLHVLPCGRSIPSYACIATTGKARAAKRAAVSES